MNRILRTTLCTTAFAALALSGCSNDVGGEVTTVDQAVADAEASSPSDEERTVDDLDVDAAAQNPCVLLTDEQLAGLQLVEPGELDESGGVGQCSWSNRESTSVKRLFAGRDDVAGGIAELTANSASFPFFEAGIEVAGRPSVHYDTMAEPIGQCSVQVDLTADSALLITAYLAEEDPAYHDPCTKSDEIASLMIENIHAGF
ncbi:DUF3558 domain-containing protein [Actinoalloteichus hymeniacidonis]|uniref:DUF3558 family protein n=1 Tax=Actinoalloteichus hymeniacidonis TaxID=340345 RepID=A0AAC9HN87_9PSEU|nr:DUF3558 domain-containing protein [Actinoalloteichus hymeniacidonis]AOS62395.1 putative DUF3558 family protein [Actinoalloteichus hymeniacidonis]MBB5909575.1 hypothetical protein [Actinoalloteichus hymeniacidonis]